MMLHDASPAREAPTRRKAAWAFPRLEGLSPVMAKIASRRRRRGAEELAPPLPATSASDPAHVVARMAANRPTSAGGEPGGIE
jgi:hypothetical protein